MRARELHELRTLSIDFINTSTKARFYDVHHDLFAQHGVDLEVVMKKSKSESGQDLFALLATEFKRKLTFLEIGAYDGFTFSNSFLLEKHFDWSGLLVEPIPKNFSKISSVRESRSLQAAITKHDVHSVEVYEAPASNLSKLKHHGPRNSWIGRHHTVQGLSINTLMQENFPSGKVDFLSIDIEGAEYEVLQNLDFSRFHFMAIVVEHNFRDDSKDLLLLFESKGYMRVFEEFSGNDFWFVPTESSVMWE